MQHKCSVTDKALACFTHSRKINVELSIVCAFLSCSFLCMHVYIGTHATACM